MLFDGFMTSGLNGNRLPFDLEAVERAAVVRALAAAGNNRSQAARLLGIARQQLYHRLKKFGLEDPAPSS